jgi:GNAT superfamily N-acetyltransferase
MSTRTVSAVDDSELHIRRATAADALSIATVHVRSWKAAYPGLIPQSYLDALTPQDRLATWEEVLGGAPSALSGTLVAVDATDSIVGFASFGPNSDDDMTDAGVGEVRALYLDPSAWGRGAGAKLLRAATDELARGSCHTATLWVLDTNDRARGFYERTGWRPDGVTKLHDWKAFVATDARYRLDLL